MASKAEFPVARPIADAGSTRLQEIYLATRLFGNVVTCKARPQLNEDKVAG